MGSGVISFVTPTDVFSVSMRRHYLVPNNLAKRGKWRKKGSKLHIFNEHVFVARHIPK